jgi:RNA polymerase sigma-70 factor (ECF subfamily)
MDARSDDDLLAATRSEPEAFAVFYRRHVGPLLAFFARRTRDAELAADLTAETFAAALAGAHRHRPERGPAAAWLYGIARRQLSHATHKGAVEDRARRRLGMGPITLTDEGLERVEALAVAGASAEILREGLAALPADQRDAVLARVLDEDEYAVIATRARTSESVIRKRVSRGLTGLRQRLEGPASAMPAKASR